MKNILDLLFFLLLFQISCTTKVDKKNFDTFLNESCMIINEEQENSIEGEYITVIDIQQNDSTIYLKLPSNFQINNSNYKNWVLGWGTNNPLYDAGVENIRAIDKIDTIKKVIFLGNVLRGKGFPEKGQRLVFWNIKPSGFYNYSKKPTIEPSIWPEFTGESIHFSSIEFDSTLKKWIIIANECDSERIQIYAAMSDNLKDWQAANNGKPILTASDFRDCKWAGTDKTGKVSQSPFSSDIVRHNNKWYLFLDGYSHDGKRNIGLAVSETTLVGPYKINKEPLLQPGAENSWNNEACFYPKVKKYKDGFIMFYDGRNSKGNERVGMAFSKDLINWKNSIKNPVIDQHSGWRSFTGSSEPNCIEVRNDSIFLMIAGVKKFKMGPLHHYITKRMYMDKSGNVDDAQLGIYVSTNGGETFIPHINNPVFTNDYTNVYENEHMGGNFKLIKTDTADYIFYQAKSSFNGFKYNILQRIKLK